VVTLAGNLGIIQAITLRIKMSRHPNTKKKNIWMMQPS